ncbi:hypothetical protein PRIPAC_80992, partial [Pristionchus pacificus]|uniref:Uncharacterized protein n=1 Tax=Pristionchus pacificus TaxID=54126 RepID=A0A2A6BX52_PRIPA
MATRAGRIEQEIRRTVKEEQHNEVSLRKQLAGQGKDKDEVDRAIGKMLTSGELVADHYCKAPKGRLSFTEELRKINPPLVLRARLDMSGRIRHALLSYRKENNEVTRDALQALCKQVYTIENFTAADYDNFFDYGLRRAVEEGLIEEVVEGEERMYRSGERKSKILMCVLCANTKSNVHERILKCTNCLWQRHASCMGLRKHKITGDFECEKCARCRDCGKE